MRTPAVLRALRCTAAVGASICIVLVSTRVRHVNHTTVALLLVLLILGISTRWGSLEALAASLAGGLGFNYFFLPPSGLGLEAPERWVTLGAFMLTAIVTGQLSARAAANLHEAKRQRDEMERLYQFGNAIMANGDVEGGLERIPDQITEILRARAATFFAVQNERVFHCGPLQDRVAEERLRSVAATGNPLIDTANRCFVVPVRRGAELAGSLGIAGAAITQLTAEAVAERVSVALAKALTAQESVAAELARRSEIFKSAVLDALAHEIKSPLATVKVSISTLLSGQPGNAQQQRELLEIIGEESDRLERWIDSATEVSQSEAGQLRLEKKANSLKPVALRALEGLGPLGTAGRIETRIPDSLPLAVFDAGMIERVIRLMLDNALKYSPAGSPIAISAEYTGAEILLAVEDHGYGIPEGEREEIFEPYYRGRNTAAKTQGTGLGLSSAKCIMQAHGGEIWVTGAPGGGSKFQISLPATMKVPDGRPQSIER